MMYTVRVCQAFVIPTRAKVVCDSRTFLLYVKSVFLLSNVQYSCHNMYPNFKNLCIGTYGGPNTHKPFLDHRVSGSASDGALVDCWSNLPADVLEKVLLFIKDPCKTRLNQLCSTNRNFREVCKRDAFWYTLCKREGWTREDRTTGWHAMPDPPTKTQWKDQFFKWCKLRFGPYSEKELLGKRDFLGPYMKRRLNATGLIKLGYVVEHFLALTGGTGVLDETKTYDDVVATYGPMNTWDVSRVTNMSVLFSNKREFNADISQWDTSNVTNMSLMFKGATAFNADIGGWNVSNVDSFFRMFEGASAFNQDLKDWNVSKVDSFTNMFANAIAFNQNLSDWHQLDESRVVQEEASKNGMFFNSGLSENNWPSWLRK